jgi:hypothetical protein
MDLRANTIPGSNYFFSFPLLNPPNPQPPPKATVKSTGVAIAEVPFSYADGPLAPLYISTCNQGTSRVNETGCKPCLPGTFALDCGVSECSSCDPGTYSAAGRSSCQDCPAGTYASSRGTSTCTWCADGQYGPVQGAMNRNEGCLDCPVGKYSRSSMLFDTEMRSWTSVGSGICSVCPRAFWCPGATDRVPCPKGTWSNVSALNRSSGCGYCAHGDRCTGAWPRITCNAPGGYEHGKSYGDVESCVAVCWYMNNSRGEVSF